MNKYLKNLNRVEFVVTSACTGNCRHCSQGEHRINESINKNLAADAVVKISQNYKIQSVMTFGGEPLLCVDTVCAIHSAAKLMNIPHRQLITNGYFSKDTDKIKFVAKQLIDSGINDILISVDAFHQETIPLDIVKIFADHVKDYAKDSDVKIRVQPAWLVSEDDNNTYNNRTKEILKEFTEMGIEPNEGNIIFPSGNALKYLSEYFNSDNVADNPYEENPSDIKAICFSANGDILGSNIYEKDIIEILNSYAP